MSEREVIIYDWNHEGSERLRNSNFRLLDTTLRDGVQTPGIRQPSLEEKLRIIDFDAQVGIEAIDICLPADRKTRYFQEGVECARYINEKYPGIDIVVLTPTSDSYVESTLEFAKMAGIRLSPILFRGSSDLRLLAEDWREEEVIGDMFRFSKQLTDEGHSVIAATEDTTRSRPEFLREIFRAGKAGGAKEFCIADTVGYADPVGVSNLVTWVREEVVEGDGLQIQFHGHDDTRNAVSNSISALVAGADTIHVTWLGAGERAGNTPIEGVLSDLYRRGISRYDLSHILKGSNHVARAYEVTIPRNLPLVGDIVFKSESGIHVAAMHKAKVKNLDGIGGIVYSAVDPRSVGRAHEVFIGPQGGAHSVQWVLEELGIEYSDKLRDELLTHARAANRTLTKEEITGFIREMRYKENHNNN